MRYLSEEEESAWKKLLSSITMPCPRWYAFICSQDYYMRQRLRLTGFSEADTDRIMQVVYKDCKTSTRSVSESMDYIEQLTRLGATADSLEQSIGRGI